jgi:hypothetical protein
MLVAAKPTPFHHTKFVPLFQQINWWNWHQLLHHTVSTDRQRLNRCPTAAAVAAAVAFHLLLS